MIDNRPSALVCGRGLIQPEQSDALIYRPQNHGGAFQLTGHGHRPVRRV
jgi:hypothetical protein